MRTRGRKYSRMAAARAESPTRRPPRPIALGPQMSCEWSQPGVRTSAEVVRRLSLARGGKTYMLCTGIPNCVCFRDQGLLSVALLSDHRVCCLFLRCLTGCLSASTVVSLCDRVEI